MIKPRLGLIKTSCPPFNHFFCIVTVFVRGVWIARARGRNQVVDWRMVSVLHQDEEAYANFVLDSYLQQKTEAMHR